MTEEQSLTQIFSEYHEHINSEQELREEIRQRVRDLDQTLREIHTQLQLVHQQEGIKNVKDFCQRSETSFTTVRTQFTMLADKVPTGQYYRFHDHWKTLLQRASFLCALTVYLQTEKLISREETAEKLGLGTKQADGFHLDLDDFLIGLLTLASELSRLAVNAVTACDYGLPMRIAKFIAELDDGFRLLNLKNDNLRKRFDGLKYDLKKVEEVVYDLSIRGLKPQADPPKE